MELCMRRHRVAFRLCAIRHHFVHERARAGARALPRSYSFSFAFLHAATNQPIFFFPHTAHSLSLFCLSLLVSRRLFPFLLFTVAVPFFVQLRLFFFNRWWIKLYIYSCSCCFGCVTESLLFCGFCVLSYHYYSYYYGWCGCCWY